jgi:hypothetical protein
MTVGMAFQKGIILELVLTTSYLYSYGFLACHDCTIISGQCMILGHILIRP